MDPVNLRGGGGAERGRQGSAEGDHIILTATLEEMKTGRDGPRGGYEEWWVLEPQGWLGKRSCEMRWPGGPNDEETGFTSTRIFYPLCRGLMPQRPA